jgi:hypothetical protein
MNRLMYILISAVFAVGSHQILTDAYEQPYISALMGFGVSFFFFKAILGD